MTQRAAAAVAAQIISDYDFEFHCLRERVASHVAWLILLSLVLLPREYIINVRLHVIAQ